MVSLLFPRTHITHSHTHTHTHTTHTLQVLVGPRTKKPVKGNVATPEEGVPESEVTNTSTVNFASTALDSIESSVDPPQENVTPNLLQQDSVATTNSEESFSIDQPDSEVDPPQESVTPDLLQQDSVASTTDSEENVTPNVQQDSLDTCTTDSEVDSPPENVMPDLQQDSVATDSEDDISAKEEPRAN